MNVTITIVGNDAEVGPLLQALARATEPFDVTAAPVRVASETPISRKIEAGEPYVSETSPEKTIPNRIKPHEPVFIAEELATAEVEEELPVEPPKVPKAPRKPKADKAVVGTIPSAPKAVKADAAPATRDGAKLAMEKFVKAHGTLDLAKRMGAFGGARRLTDIPDDKLDEFVKAIEV